MYKSAGLKPDPGGSTLLEKTLAESAKELIASGEFKYSNSRDRGRITDADAHIYEYRTGVCGKGYYRLPPARGAASAALDEPVAEVPSQQVSSSSQNTGDDSDADIPLRSSRRAKPSARSFSFQAFSVHAARDSRTLFRRLL